MEQGKYENNTIALQGKVAGEIEYSHEVYDEPFYTTYVDCKRISGTYDRLPVTIGESLMGNADLNIDDDIMIAGQIRSYNRFIDGKRRLLLTVFARRISIGDTMDPQLNSVQLEGFVCKPPIFRTTPFLREICDILLAVNRPYRKSDYIPVIVWGESARKAGIIPVGSKIIVNGRMQSREYVKKMSDGIMQKRVAYEVSATRVALPDGLGGSIDIEMI